MLEIRQGEFGGEYQVTQEGTPEELLPIVIPYFPPFHERGYDLRDVLCAVDKSRNLFIQLHAACYIANSSAQPRPLLRSSAKNKKKP